MICKLQKEDLKFLIRNISNKELKTFFRKLYIEQISEKTVLCQLSKYQIENILDMLSNLLMEKGLNADSEPNEFGLKIEHLIDIFNGLLFEKN